MSSRPIPETVWRSPSGEVLSCIEKLKVLRENLEQVGVIAFSLVAREKPPRPRTP